MISKEMVLETLLKIYPSWCGCATISNARSFGGLATIWDLDVYTFHAFWSYARIILTSYSLGPIHIFCIRSIYAPYNNLFSFLGIDGFNWDLYIHPMILLGT